MTTVPVTADIRAITGLGCCYSVQTGENLSPFSVKPEWSLKRVKVVEMREQCGLNLGHKGNGVKYDSKVWNMIERSSLEKWQHAGDQINEAEISGEEFQNSEE